MNYKISLVVFFLILQTAFGVFAKMPKITFMPHWLPQAQFAGYYVAKHKGFYEKEGITVDIIHPSASVIATTHLKRGDVDVISLFLVTAINSVNDGLKMVNIAQISQNSGMLFVSKKDKKITPLNDLKGKKIGIWKDGFDEIPKALIHSKKINVTWVPILSSINMFMLNGVDAMTVMWYNEYDQIINAGINPNELNTLFFSECGYNTPEDGLYCMENTCSSRKADLQKFVKGSLKGWEYTKTHQKEALEIVLTEMKKAHIATNYAHQKWMLEKVLQLMEPSSPKIKKGVLAEPDFNKVQRSLLNEGFIQKTMLFHDFYKPVL